MSDYYWKGYCCSVHQWVGWFSFRFSPFQRICWIWFSCACLLIWFGSSAQVANGDVLLVCDSYYPKLPLTTLASLVLQTPSPSIRIWTCTSADNPTRFFLLSLTAVQSCCCFLFPMKCGVRCGNFSKAFVLRSKATSEEACWRKLVSNACQNNSGEPVRERMSISHYVAIVKKGK